MGFHSPESLLTNDNLQPITMRDLSRSRAKKGAFYFFEEKKTGLLL